MLHCVHMLHATFTCLYLRTSEDTTCRAICRVKLGLRQPGIQESAQPRRATKEGQWVLRTPLHIRTLVFLCSAWF